MFGKPTDYGTFAILASDGTIQYCSPGFSALVATSPADQPFAGADIMDWLTPDTGVFDPHGSPKGIASFRRKKGNLPYLLQALPADANQQGCILFLREEETQHTSDNFRDLYAAHAFDLNPGLSAITVLTTGKHLDVNKAWLDAMGYERDEVIGKTAAELNLWGGPSDQRAKIVERLKASKSIDNFEAQLRTKGGDLLDIVVCARLVEYNNQALAFFASLDISKINKEKKLRAASEKYASQWREMAYLDGLTSVSNRRRFDLSLEEEWARCARHSKPLAILLLDIDYFKKYNDLYGHQAGDKCLHDVAQALAGTLFRPGDLLCRYGGEEFAAILPETACDGAREVGQRMLDAVHGLQIEHKASTVASAVTVSIGIAWTFPTHKQSAEGLTASADQQLYNAKKGGRARMSFSDKPSG